MTKVLIANGVEKSFRRRAATDPRTLKEWIARPHLALARPKKLQALQGIDLGIDPGEAVGIVGHNGAGKSTLLRILGGVMKPDKGSVEILGRIGGLLNINCGMHEELSGRENILINGVISGLTLREVRERTPAIIEFSELDEFIDGQFRTFSSGMKLRLGFAIASQIEPDILLIDEILSVGDIAFQRKCLDRLSELKQSGTSMIIVSHDLEQLEGLCDRIVWLENGKVAGQGPPQELLPRFRNRMIGATLKRREKLGLNHDQPDIDTSSPQRLGTHEFSIKTVRILGPSERDIHTVKREEKFSVEVAIAGPETAEMPIVQMSISRDDGSVCMDVNSREDEIDFPPFEGKAIVNVELARLDLEPGKYRISVGLYEPNWSYIYDYFDKAAELEVTNPARESRLFDPPRQWNVTTVA